LNSNTIKKDDGMIIILSYPDTIVRPAYWEPSSKIWPIIGIGGKHAVQAGHAALVLIKNGDAEVKYFDFGRYITSYGNGRVRSQETDPELIVPIKAKFENNALTNLSEILLWLDNHPEKTHGDGRLIATVNNNIDYSSALNFINNLINRKEIPYGVFVKNGSNCSRFVTDTLITSLTNKKIKLLLKKSNLLTPSPIGNVIKATSTNIIYEVKNQKISLYKNRSILKEYKESFLNRFDTAPNLIGTELPDLNAFSLKNGTWLGGIGSGAWFTIEAQIDIENYTIARYDSLGKKDFIGKFLINNNSFKIDEKYEFVYPTNGKEVYLVQNKKEFILNAV
tara:strand:+ start:24033 stop:25040 length:1008 start_codon:yes stop_codon:yes gene_type:complete